VNVEQKMVWSWGFDAGNYAAAYTLDPDQQTFDDERPYNWQTLADAEMATRPAVMQYPELWRQGFLAGYYSSCELHEVLEIDREAVVTARQMQARMERDGQEERDEATEGST